MISLRDFIKTIYIFIPPIQATPENSLSNSKIIRAF